MNNDALSPMACTHSAAMTVFNRLGGAAGDRTVTAMASADGTPAQRSLDLIDAMYAAAEAAQPIIGRGIGYKLFTAGLIPSAGRSDMQRVFRLLKSADPW